MAGTFHRFPHTWFVTPSSDRSDHGAFGGPDGHLLAVPAISIPAVPYSGFPAPVPGKIEAEAFDWTPNQRVEENPATGKGYSVLTGPVDRQPEYTVHVTIPGNYDLSVRAAAEQNNGKLRFELDDKALAAPVTIPRTETNRPWHSVKVTGIHLPAGTHVLRMVAPDGRVSVNWFYFTLSSQTLPHGWKNKDIGNTAFPGFSGYSKGVYYIGGSGSNKSNYAVSDNVHFAYTKFSGDFQLVCRIRAQSYTHDWAKAGLMVRQSLEADSQFAFLAVTPTISPVLYYRAEKGKVSDFHNWLTRGKYNWLKIARKGNRFTGLKSIDGKNWIQLAEWASDGKAEIPIGKDVYIGFAISSQHPDKIATAAFDIFAFNTLNTSKIKLNPRNIKD